MTPEEKAAADAAAKKAAEGGNDFSALLADLNKAMPAALAGGDSSSEEIEGDSSEEEVRPGKMGKSFKVKLEGGDEMEAVDGTELLKAYAKKQGKIAKALSAAQPLIKALVDSNTALGTKVAKLEKDTEGLTKALEASTAANAELKKSFDVIADKGKGRKSATVVLPDVKDDKGNPKGMEPRQFMAKALRMQAEGKGGVTGQDVATAEASLNRGVEVPLHIVQKVLADAA